LLAIFVTTNIYNTSFDVGNFLIRSGSASSGIGNSIKVKTGSLLQAISQ